MADIQSTAPGDPSREAPPYVGRQSRAAILKDAEHNLRKARGLLLIADNLHTQDEGALADGVDTDTLAGLIEDIEDRINAALIPLSHCDNEFSIDETETLSQALSVLYCMRALTTGPEVGADSIMPPWRSRWLGAQAVPMYLLKTAAGLVEPVLEAVTECLKQEGAEVAHGTKSW